MTLQDYIASKKAPKKIKADIAERWQSRVVSAGLHTQGEDGAQVYLSNYGKGIGASKCLDLAFCALTEGAPEFANGMFKKAAQLEGITLGVSDAGNPNAGLPNPIAAAISNVQRATVQAVNHPGFPNHMQPGKFVPMQPVDAAQDQSHYIRSNGFWGQPKIDGNKLIIFAAPDVVYYQSRQLKLNPMPNAGVDQALRNAAAQLGSFILEGEITFLDYLQKEHRTAAQALTTNKEAGQESVLPKMQYVVFSAPYWSYRGALNYGEMVRDGNEIATHIKNCGSSIVVPIQTAKTLEEKKVLAANQLLGGREGEVWFNPRMPYTPGKQKWDNFVRTKYLMEFAALVTGFTETTAEGHAFGAMSIRSTVDGRDLGNVGTGFTREDKRELLDRFERTGPFLVNIICQGMTEDKKCWHARFDSIVR